MKLKVVRVLAKKRRMDKLEKRRKRKIEANKQKPKNTPKKT
jgi:hypothetical protein